MGQLQLLDYGNPKYMEKGMETSLRMADDVTGINKAGHRHIRSRLYGGTKITTEDPWQWTVNRSYLVLHSSQMVAWYNGNEKVTDMITGLADGLLAHYRNGYFYTDINFETDEDKEDLGIAKGSKPLTLFHAAYDLSRDKKYLAPLPPVSPEKGKFNPALISERYRNEITNLAINEYINTEGSPWIDRVSSFNPQIQEDRLGGVALTRTGVLYPANYVSWKFKKPENFDDVAVFLPSPSENELKIIAYNLSVETVTAGMSVWRLKPGRWSIRSGIDNNEDNEADAQITESVITLERGSEIPLSFVPGKYTIVNLRLIEGSSMNHSMLPDPAICDDDITIEGSRIKVRVHNIGAVASQSISLVVKDNSGTVVATASVPAIDAPSDLRPKWKEVTVDISENAEIRSCIIELDAEGKNGEITRGNNVVNVGGAR